MRFVDASLIRSSSLRKPGSILILPLPLTLPLSENRKSKRFPACAVMTSIKLTKLEMATIGMTE